MKNYSIGWKKANEKKDEKNKKLIGYMAIYAIACMVLIGCFGVAYQTSEMKKEIGEAPVVNYSQEEYYKTVKKPIEEVYATVYSYNSEVGQTDDQPSIMASGAITYDGAVACPDRFAFGTKVEIAGKIYTCEDRMNERYRKGNNFDIWMADKDESIEWGKQKLIVKIYE